MKFSATKEKLLEGLQEVQNVVSTRTTLPILSNVLLQATDGEVHLTTTDLDVGVREEPEVAGVVGQRDRLPGTAATLRIGPVDVHLEPVPIQAQPRRARDAESAV